MGKYRETKKEKKVKPTSTFGKIWYFIWEEDSWQSWIVNIILAFILIKFIVYPGLGFLFATSHPIVAVVSGSMYHGLEDRGDYYDLCGNHFSEKAISNSYDNWWKYCGSFYEEKEISKTDFKKFSMSNGFGKGDIILLRGIDSNKLKAGDIIVFTTMEKSYPVIHRVIDVTVENGAYYYTTKGDHNSGSAEFESKIPSSRVIGKATIRIPYLGYVKIIFVELLRTLHILA